MLWLHRNGRFNELYKCHISQELIGPGEYYYQDDEDGLIVKATIYHDMLREKRESEFDYSRLNNAENQREYEEILKEYQRSLNASTLLDRKVAGKGGV